MRTLKALAWAMAISGVVVAVGPGYWPWWLVLAPLVVPFGVFIVALLLGLGLHAALVFSGLKEGKEDIQS